MEAQHSCTIDRCKHQVAEVKAVVFDFAASRAGQHARDFLEVTPEAGWRGTLVCDDFSGYKSMFSMGIVEVGCLAHARRKFYDLWANLQSAAAEEALQFFSKLYDIERQLQGLDVDERQQYRQRHARPVADLLWEWLTKQR